MGVTKSEIFSPAQNHIADLAKIFAHPARIAIIQHLFEVEACICGDLVDEIGLAQSTISQHLKELKNQSLIQGNIDGVKVCYCINPEKWNEIGQVFNDFFNKKAKINNCCK